MKHVQLSIIADLVKPVANKLDKSTRTTIEDVLSYSLEFVAEKYSIDFENLKYPCANDDSSWKFVCLALVSLEDLKKKISSAEKIEDELISLNERKEILSCIEFIISLGLLPYLLPGVGIPPESRLQRTEHLQSLQSLTHFQKYERLCIVVRSLLSLKDEFVFQSVIIPQFFNDILAALFQLCYTPLKKPTQEVDPVTSENQVTPAMWNSLQDDREEFFQKFESLVAKSHQPLLIKEIMVIQGNRNCPRWLKIACSKILSDRLTQPGGLRATILAICDSDCESPVLWRKLDVITRILASPNSSHAQDYLDKIIPQLLEALRSSGSRENKFESIMKQVSVRCIRLFSEATSIPESRQVFQLILKPFLKPSLSISENEISTCISDLLTCFSFSNNEMFRMSPKSAVPIIYKLFLALVKLNNSPLALKNDVKELIFCVIINVQEDENLMLEILLMFLFNDVKYCRKNYSVSTLDDLKFQLGDNGGLCYAKGTEELFSEETSSIILDLLMEKDTKRDILKKLFIRLISNITSNTSDINDFEQKLVMIKSLSLLASDEKIQNVINENPRLIIDFIKSILSQSSCDSDAEISCLGLMILEVILTNITTSSVCSDKSYFKTLIEPLSKTLETAQNEEIRSLVERLVHLIEKQTAEHVKSTATNVLVPKNNVKKTVSFEEAMRDVCDPLLPARAHGIMQLTKLVRSKDREALAKKDALFCLFRENLKHEDSYLYLSAVEGLASLAAELPDSVMISLIEEFTTGDIPELRLKVGETLLKCSKLLGDLIPTYKVELLNAFLSGTRDLDPMVRASSLSNLGEACQLLGFRVGSIISEILQCISSIITSDKEAEPRRAAVMVVTMLLKGLQKDTFHVLEAHLLSLYRALKQIYDREQDDVVKLHAQLALQELNEITKEFLFPQQTLTKKIQILDIT